MNKIKEADGEYKTKNAIQEAINYGLDVTLLYSTLALTPTQRMKRHDNFLKEIAELRKAGEKKHAKF
ncbi:MAG: hypothetical protein AB1414_10270 [bacterium]